MLSPHSFRRTYATVMYRLRDRNGSRVYDLEQIRQLMGHSNIRTTIRYIKEQVRLNEIFGPYEFDEFR